MRALIALSVLLFCTSVQALGRPDYFSLRKWIERECATNTTPQDERLFVGHIESPRFANVLHFRPGITLREIIDQTPLKGKVVFVQVLRLDYLKTGPFTRYAYIRVGSSENPNYEVKSQDVIWLRDEEGEVDI